jgi:pimeloyl-ACP methyl ester carboxylesterase
LLKRLGAVENDFDIYSWSRRQPHELATATSPFQAGFGDRTARSPRGSGFKTIRQYTESVQEYLRENEIRNPLLVGHSMGGAIAIEYALSHVNLQGLVLVGTGARLRVRKDLMVKVMEDYEQASRSIAQLSVSPSCEPLLIERIAREMLKVRADVTYGDFEACNSFDRMNDVGQIAAHTLILCGADDLLTPPKYSEYLHRKIQHSELIIMPGAGHSVMLEKYREFNKALESFMASLSSSDPVV